MMRAALVGRRTFPHMKNTPRRGTTLVELMLALSVLAVTLLIALPGSAVLRDRAAVRSATSELEAALSLARSAALAESRVVAVRMDTVGARAIVLAAADTLLDLPLGGRYHVSLEATRDSIAWGPTGRGYGAANATLRIARGAAADTIFVSRLGRVRR